MVTPSPCTGVCTLDAAGAICVGCLRTLDEIARWGTTNEADRRMIAARIEERRHART